MGKYKLDKPVVPPLVALEAIRRVNNCAALVDVPEGWSVEVLVEYARRLRARATEIRGGNPPRPLTRSIPVVDVARMQVVYTSGTGDTSVEVYLDNDCKPALFVKRAEPFHFAAMHGRPLSTLLIAALTGLDVIDHWENSHDGQNLSQQVRDTALRGAIRVLPEHEESLRRMMNLLFSR